MGVVTAVVLALWIWIVVRPTTLIWGGWLATIVACLYLVARLAREVHFGVARIRNMRAVEARPPEEMEWQEGRKEGRQEGP